MTDSSGYPYLSSTEVAGTFSGKTILITGAMGYIGSFMAEILTNVDCKLMLLGNSRSIAWIPQKTQAEVSVFYGDVTVKKTWEEVLPGVDFIYHFAALEYDRSGFDVMLDLKVNTISLLHLLEACRENGYRPRVIFSSSANLFGHVKTLPVNEGHRDDPVSLWSLHKLMAEQYLRHYARAYGIQSIALRLTNVYGPTRNPEAANNVVVNRMISRALAGEGLTLYANKDCIRDYVFLGDVVNAFLHASSREVLSTDAGFYIIGSGERRTIDEVWKLIAEKVRQRTGINIPVVVDNSVKIEPLDMRDFIADTTRFRNATGWKPLVLLEEGIEQTVNALSQMRTGRFC